jgi:hypothetical protein
MFTCTAFGSYFGACFGVFSLSFAVAAAFVYIFSVGSHRFLRWTPSWPTFVFLIARAVFGSGLVSSSPDVRLFSLPTRPDSQNLFVDFPVFAMAQNNDFLSQYRSTVLRGKCCM